MLSGFLWKMQKSFFLMQTVTDSSWSLLIVFHSMTWWHDDASAGNSSPFAAGRLSRLTDMTCLRIIREKNLGYNLVLALLTQLSAKQSFNIASKKEIRLKYVRRDKLRSGCSKSDRCEWSSLLHWSVHGNVCACTSCFLNTWFKLINLSKLTFLLFLSVH